LEKAVFSFHQPDFRTQMAKIKSDHITT